MFENWERASRGQFVPVKCKRNLKGFSLTLLYKLMFGCPGTAQYTTLTRFTHSLTIWNTDKSGENKSRISDRWYHLYSRGINPGRIACLISPLNAPMTVLKVSQIYILIRSGVWFSEVFEESCKSGLWKKPWGWVGGWESGCSNPWGNPSWGQQGELGVVFCISNCICNSICYYICICICIWGKPTWGQHGELPLPKRKRFFGGISPKWRTLPPSFWDIPPHFTV